MIAAYAPQYVKFANDEYVYGAYGHRLANNVHNDDQLKRVVTTLSQVEESRQVVVSLWKPCDLKNASTGKYKDVPCTLTWQFFIRDGELHMCANMRSNDVWLGLPYDVFVNTCIQQILARELCVKVGTYTHMVGSLHLYDKNEVAAREALYCDDPWLSNEWIEGMTFEEVNTLIHLEQQARIKGILEPSHNFNKMLRDLIGCLYLKWGDNKDRILSPALTYGVNNDRNRRS